MTERHTLARRFAAHFKQGRRAPYPLFDYWVGVDGVTGDVGQEWSDKPHRLVFDLLNHAVFQESELASLRDANKALAVKAGKLHDYANMRDVQVVDLVARAEAAEAKLAKVEAERDEAGIWGAEWKMRALAAEADRHRLSAELAEARADYLNASRDASNLAGKLNAAEAVIERALESLCGDYPSMAADFRSFLASKEASQ